MKDLFVHTREGNYASYLTSPIPTQNFEEGKKYLWERDLHIHLLEGSCTAVESHKIGKVYLCTKVEGNTAWIEEIAGETMEFTIEGIENKLVADTLNFEENSTYRKILKGINWAEYKKLCQDKKNAPRFFEPNMILRDAFH